MGLLIRSVVCIWSRYSYSIGDMASSVVTSLEIQDSVLKMSS